MTDKWTQHPPESKAACGGILFDIDFSSRFCSTLLYFYLFQMYPGSEASQETADESSARMTFDSQRLTTFLRSATQVKNAVYIFCFICTRLKLVPA